MTYQPPQQPPPPYQQQPPLPISPLAYGGWEQPFSRPGILTAVGIFSICLGALSFLVNAGGVFSNAAMLVMSKAPPSLFTMPPMTVTAKTATSPSVSGGIVVTPDEDGLPADQRATIIRVMSHGKTQLTQRQIDSLDALMAQAGQRIFPFAAGGTFNAQAISANITERGDIPRADQTAPVGAYYVVGTGRVEVYENHAVFRPDGSADVVSVTPAPPATGPTMQTSTVTINTSTGGTSSVTIKGGPPVNPFAAFTAFNKMNPTGIWITLVASFVSALLAIYLFVIGIMVLRDSRSGARLHWVYAMLKIPLVIVAAVGTHIMTSSMMSSFAASVPGAPGFGVTGGAGVPAATTSIMQSMMIVTAAVTAAIYLAYPLSLIFILSTRTVRDYYRALQSGERPAQY